MTDLSKDGGDSTPATTIDVSSISTEVPSTDPALGLTNDEVNESRRQHGGNHFSELPVPTLFELVKAAVADPMLIILIVCAVVALAVGAVSGEASELIDGIAITIAVL